ncbi:hypothetical protein [Chryseobacterium sp. SIMBA_029]|uniref:hypothetical protein n=1 Tax=Chryseobacterium sp. SIMBA_029 TaxID=3085772 RepID=UPI00397B40A9
MISNVPSYEDFEKVTKECLIQAFELVFQIYSSYKEYDDENRYEEVPLNEVWEHNKVTLKMSLILLHQGIEAYMKGVIVKNSPYLLLEQKRSDWPTLPDSINKDFNTMFTIAGENLLHTFCAVSSDIIELETIQFIEDIRQTRNKAIHGTSPILSDPSNIIHDILKAYTYFFGKDQWFNDIKTWVQSNPLFGYYDWNFESIQSYKYLDFLDSTIGIKQLKKFVNFNIIGRRYFCPTCLHEVKSKDGNLYSKWAFLHPNKPFSTIVYCINCNFDNEIERSDCNKKNCQGNVIDMDGICLTCGQTQ